MDKKKTKGSAVLKEVDDKDFTEEGHTHKNGGNPTPT